MYNRYDGNSGRYVRVDDAPAPPEKTGAPRKQGGTPAPPPRKSGIASQYRPERRDTADIFSRIIPNAIAELDTEDVILMLVLYLLYRESGDKDLLIMMGSLFLP